MAYTDFSLERVEADFALTSRPVELFPNLVALPVPDLLVSWLERGRRSAAIVSEKARSEFLVAPILLVLKDYIEGELSIFSGQRFDVEPSLGLSGECDFILARTPPIPRIKAPILTVLEAKRSDIELGLGQCAAQMVAARLFNDRAGDVGKTMFGCVTTGEDWQFIKLQGNELLFDYHKIYANNIGKILGALRESVV